MRNKWLTLLLVLATALPALAERNIYELFTLFYTPDFWRDATVEDVRELASELPDGVHFRVPGMDFTFLHSAAGYSKLPVVRFLLEQGLDPNAPDVSGETPVHWAATNNPDPAVVRLLVEKGGRVNARGMGGTAPLLNALADNPNPKVARTLIELGAYLDVSDSFGANVLHYAASGSRDLKLIRELVQRKGFRIDEADRRGWQPIHHAAASNTYLPTHELLVKLGADPTSPLGYGTTPLHIAAANNPEPKVVLWYVAQGNSIDVRDADGNQPVHLAGMNPNPAVIEALVERGANPRALNKYGRQPIHTAASAGNAETVRALLKMGIDPNVKDRSGLTPLLDMSLEEKPDAETARVLVEAGADLEARHKTVDLTALLYVLRFGSTMAAEDFARTLIELGADLAPENRYRMNALDLLMQNPDLRDSDLRELIEERLKGR